MTFLVHLLWKVLVPLGEGAAPTNSKLFNLGGGKSFIRRLGGDFRLEHPPVLLSPTDLFHLALRPTRLELGLDGSRFPYQFESAEPNEQFSVNFAIHRHDDSLCVTVRLAPFFVAKGADWALLQDLRQHSILWPLARKVLALALTGDSSAGLSREPQVLPALHIQAREQDWPDWKSQLVSVVTRHADVGENVVNAVLEKNQTHQVDRTLLLVDKQGVAAYVPSQTLDAAAAANLGRFDHSAEMLQLAGALRIQLRQRLTITSDASAAILDPSAAVPASVSGRRIWSLLVQEFSLVELLGTPKPTVQPDNQMSSQANSTPGAHSTPATLLRVLLVTVTTVETRALLTAVTTATGREPILRKFDGFSYQDFGRFGDYELVHFISGMGSGGIDGSQESVRRGIQAVRPSAILMVGIAFGVNRKKQPVGTILVSKQIQTYELQRINRDSITPRGDKVTAAPKLLNWVYNAEIDWPETSPKIKSGLLLSGEKLIDNRDYRNQLTKIAPEALGGEMEGAGLYAAAQNEKIDWLLVKAVCDWADGNKSKGKDQLQLQAAKAAAEFCIHMLRVNAGRRQQ